MKPSHWPDNLNHILAKSADRGGETLVQHTWDVLAKLAELHHLRPTLSNLAESPGLWHCLFWTCLLHDLGKAARGFQARLKGGEPSPHRHEVLSLVFIDWIASALNEEEQRAIVAAIVSHHRDASEVQKMYPRVDPDSLIPLRAELEPDVVSGLWHWIDTCATNWIESLGMNSAGVHPLKLMPHNEAVTLVEQRGVQRVRFWLRRYERWVDDLRGTPLPVYQVVLPILLRGLTTTADHKVFSPYQMLKAAFQLRGFEGMLTDYAQAAFIFDEIHAYEPARLALILAMVKYLRKNYGARFFVMSATFPQIIRNKLIKTLEIDGIPNPLKIRWPYEVTFRPPHPFEESPDSQVASSVEPPSS